MLPVRKWLYCANHSASTVEDVDELILVLGWLTLRSVCLPWEIWQVLVELLEPLSELSNHVAANEQVVVQHVVVCLEPPGFSWKKAVSTLSIISQNTLSRSFHSLADDSCTFGTN